MPSRSASSRRQRLRLLPDLRLRNHHGLRLELERGLDHRRQPDQVAAQLAESLRQGATQLFPGVAELPGRFSRHQVAHGLGLNQVELAVGHRSAGELSRFGLPRTGGDAGFDDGLTEIRGPVNRRLHHVLAGIRPRRGEEHDHAAVEHLASAS